MQRNKSNTVYLDKTGVIVICRYLDNEGAARVISFLNEISGIIKAKQLEKSIGFLLDSHGGDFVPIKMIIESMKALKREGFSFYVLVHNAHSTVTLIVAATNKDKRYIYRDGGITLHDGHLVLEANDIGSQNRITHTKLSAFVEAVLYYKRHIWGKVQEVPGFSQLDFSALQLSVYTQSNRLLLSTEHCTSQLGFKITEYVSERN